MNGEEKRGTDFSLKDALLLTLGVVCVLPGWLIGNMVVVMSLMGNEPAYIQYVIIQAIAITGFILLAYPKYSPLRHLVGACLATFYLINLHIIRWNFVPQMREMAKDFEEQERETGEQPQMAGGMDPQTDIIDKVDSLLFAMILLLAVMAVLMFLLFLHRSRKLKKASEPHVSGHEGRPPRKIRR